MIIEEIEVGLPVSDQLVEYISSIIECEVIEYLPLKAASKKGDANTRISL